MISACPPSFSAYPDYTKDQCTERSLEEEYYCPIPQR